MTENQQMIEMIADVTHIHLPFFLVAVCQRPMVIFVACYLWETVEWINNEYRIINSFSWDVSYGSITNTAYARKKCPRCNSCLCFQCRTR
jgi:hypothetical protein